MDIIINRNSINMQSTSSGSLGVTVLFIFAIISLTGFVRLDLKADAKEATAVRSLSINSSNINEQELEILTIGVAILGKGAS